MVCSTNLRLRGFWRLLSPLLAIEATKVDELQSRKAKGILESGVGDESSNHGRNDR